MPYIVTPTNLSTRQNEQTTPMHYMPDLLEDLRPNQNAKEISGTKLNRWVAEASQLCVMHNGSETIYVYWCLASKIEYKP